MGLAQKLFGTHSEHELKRIYPIADKIESYKESYGKLSDEELKAKTKEFKDRLAKGETLDDILPEAFDPRVADVVANAVKEHIVK